MLHQQLPHQTLAGWWHLPQSLASSLLSTEVELYTIQVGHSFELRHLYSLHGWRGLFGCDGGGEGLLVLIPLDSGVPTLSSDAGRLGGAWGWVSEGTLSTVQQW